MVGERTGREQDRRIEFVTWLAPAPAYLAVGIGLFVFHNAWGALLGFHAAIIVTLLFAKPKIPLSIFFKYKNAKWILLSVLLCGSSGVTLYLFWDIFGFAGDLAEQMEMLGLNPSNWLMFIAYFVSVNPLVEEYFWRGYLGSKNKNLHISDFLYSGFHGLILINKVPVSSIAFALGILVAVGWIWRQVHREENGLLTPVLGHMAADLTILLAIYRMVT